MRNRATHVDFGCVTLPAIRIILDPAFCLLFNGWGSEAAEYVQDGHPIQSDTVHKPTNSKRAEKDPNWKAKIRIQQMISLSIKSIQSKYHSKYPYPRSISKYHPIIYLPKSNIDLTTDLTEFLR